jgi:hypothetical protein
MKRILYLMVLICFITSCVINRNLSITPSASINNSNFKSVRACSGSSKSFYFMGIGGFNHEGLMADAKRNLYDNADLKDNQIIANVTTDEFYKYLYPLVYVHKVILTCDIIEFIDIKDTNTLKSRPYDGAMEKEIKEYNGIKLGDNIIFILDGKTTEGELFDIINGYAIIKYKINGFEKTTDRPINEIQNNKRKK